MFHGVWFPFSLLLTLHDSGSSLLQGCEAWLSAVTSSHAWVQVVAVLYAASRFLGCCTHRLPFLKKQLLQRGTINNSLQMLRQWFLDHPLLFWPSWLSPGGRMLVSRQQESGSCLLQKPLSPGGHAHASPGALAGTTPLLSSSPAFSALNAVVG